MNKYLGLFLIISTILSCEKDEKQLNDNSNDDSNYNSYFWSPIVEVKRGNKEATLFLIDPRSNTLYWGPPPSDPEYFEIYYSKDINSFNYFNKLNFSTDSVIIPNLVNGDPYYFMITSNKANCNPKFSDTIMTVPSIDEKPEELLPNLSFSMEKVSISPDGTYITFISKNYSDQYYGTSMLYYKSVFVDSAEIVESGSTSANWSPIMNIFVYILTKKVGIYIYPYKLKLFDVQTKQETTLFEVDYDKYYISTPAFSPDGKHVCFLSSENSSEKYIYNLWSVDLSTKEKTKILDFQSIEFSNAGNLNWSSNPEEIYLDGYYQRDSHRRAIYKFNIPENKLVPIIKSLWNDKTPSISPNNSMIAFISDRTGNDELWVYNLVSLKYQQITPISSYLFDSRITNIQWLNNNKILLTVIEGKTSNTLKIEIKQ